MGKATVRTKLLKSAMEWVRDGVKEPATRERVESLLTEMRLTQDLVALREDRGLTQVQLAERVGVKQPAIAQIEGGRANDIKLSTLVKIASGLGARVRITFEKDVAAARPSKVGRKKTAVA